MKLVFWHVFDVEHADIVDLKHEQDCVTVLGLGGHIQLDRGFVLIFLAAFFGDELSLAGALAAAFAQRGLHLALAAYFSQLSL